MEFELMNFEIAKDKDLLWISNSCSFHRILSNILLNNDITYKSPVIHCSLNRCVQSYSTNEESLIKHFQWELNFCSIIFNLKAVYKYVLNVNVNDLLLLNVFNYEELIKNNDIMFVIPEQLKNDLSLILVNFFNTDDSILDNVIYSYDIEEIYNVIIRQSNIDMDKSYFKEDIVSNDTEVLLNKQLLIINEYFSFIKTCIINILEDRRESNIVENISEIKKKDLEPLNFFNDYYNTYNKSPLMKCYKKNWSENIREKTELYPHNETLNNLTDNQMSKYYRKYYSPMYNYIILDSRYPFNLKNTYFNPYSRMYNFNNESFYYDYYNCNNDVYIKITLSYHVTGAVIKALSNKSSSDNIHYLMFKNILSGNFGVEKDIFNEKLSVEEKDEYKEYIKQYENKLSFKDYDNLEFYYIYDFVFDKNNNNIIDAIKKYQLNEIELIKNIDCVKCINRYTYLNFFENVLDHNGSAVFIFSSYSYNHRMDFNFIINKIKEFIRKKDIKEFYNYLDSFNKIDISEDYKQHLYQSFIKSRDITYIEFYLLIFYFSILKDNVIMNIQCKEFLIEIFCRLFIMNEEYYVRIKKIQKRDILLNILNGLFPIWLNITNIIKSINKGETEDTIINIINSI